MTGLIARGRFVLSGDVAAGRLIERAAVYAEGGWIRAVGPADEIERRYPDARRVGDERHIVLPGLVNAHHHARGATWLQRGHPDEPLDVWLLGFRFAPPIDAALDAGFSAERLLRSGVTTVLVSHWAPADERLEAQTRALVGAMLATGLRVVLAIGILDRSAWDDPALHESLPTPLAAELRARLARSSEQDVARAFDLFHRLRAENGERDGRLTVALGPVSPQWCSPDVLAEVARVSSATSAPVHTHALETQGQQASARREHGRPLLAHLASTGFLSPRVSLAHCVALADEDIDALAATGPTVVHCPSSNLRLGSGIAPVRRLRARGVRVALGTDSQGMRDDDDMWSEIGLARSLAAVGSDGLSLGAADAIACATSEGAAACGLDGETGRIEPGRRADLVLVDVERLARPAAVRDEIALDLVVGRATGAYVDAVVVGGEVIIEDGRPLRFDPAERATRIAEVLSLAPRDAQTEAFVAEIKRHVARERAGSGGASVAAEGARP